VRPLLLNGCARLGGIDGFVDFAANLLKSPPNPVAGRLFVINNQNSMHRQYESSNEI
jgi:hypothetical protein